MGRIIYAILHALFWNGILKQSYQRNGQVISFGLIVDYSITVDKMAQKKTGILLISVWECECNTIFFFSDAIGEIFCVGTRK